MARPYGTQGLAVPLPRRLRKVALAKYLDSWREDNLPPKMNIQCAWLLVRSGGGMFEANAKQVGKVGVL